MRSTTTFWIYIIVILLCFSACEGETSKSKTKAQDEITKPKKAKMTMINKLDNYDLKSMEKVKEQKKEADNCVFDTQQFQKEKETLVIHRVDCGHVRSNDTYFLLNPDNSIQAIHEKNIEPYDEEGNKRRFIILSEKLVSFDGEETSVMMRRDTVGWPASNSKALNKKGPFKRMKKTFIPIASSEKDTKVVWEKRYEEVWK